MYATRVKNWLKSCRHTDWRLWNSNDCEVALRSWNLAYTLTTSGAYCLISFSTFYSQFLPLWSVLCYIVLHRTKNGTSTHFATISHTQCQFCSIIDKRNNIAIIIKQEYYTNTIHRAASWTSIHTFFASNGWKNWITSTWPMVISQSIMKWST